MQNEGVKVQAAINVIDSMKPVQFQNGSLIFQDRDGDGPSKSNINILSVQSGDIDTISGQVADELVKGNKWKATFDAAYKAVFPDSSEPAQKAVVPAETTAKTDKTPKDKTVKTDKTPKDKTPKTNKPGAHPAAAAAAPVAIPDFTPVMPKTWRQSAAEFLVSDPIAKAALQKSNDLANWSSQRSQLRAQYQATVNAINADPLYNNDAAGKQARLSQAQADYEKQLGPVSEQNAGQVMTAWTAKATQDIQDMFKTKIADAIPQLKANYELSLNDPAGYSSRARSLEAQLQLKSGLLGEHKPQVERYFADNWNADGGNAAQVEKNYAACMGAHGFIVGVHAASPEYLSQQSARYSSPDMNSVDLRCVAPGLKQYLQALMAKPK
jgi:hypothetical protein